MVDDVIRDFFRTMGAKGGKASWAKLTPEQRARRAKKAVRARERKRKRLNREAQILREQAEFLESLKKFRP